MHEKCSPLGLGNLTNLPRILANVERCLVSQPGVTCHRSTAAYVTCLQRHVLSVLVVAGAGRRRLCAPRVSGARGLRHGVRVRRRAGGLCTMVFLMHCTSRQWLCEVKQMGNWHGVHSPEISWAGMHKRSVQSHETLWRWPPELR